MKTLNADTENDGRQFRPLQVLNHHLDAIRYWERNPFAVDFAATFEPLVDHILKGKTTLQRYLADRLDRCDSVFVRSHIITRLRQLAESHDDISEPLLPQDLPCDGGFVWLETPIYIKESRGRTTSIRAIFWHKETNGVMIAMFSDAMDMDDDISREARDQWKDFSKTLERSGRIPIMCVTGWTWGQDIRNINPEQFGTPPLMTEEEAHVYRQDLDVAVEDQIQTFKFILALWEFMGEQVPYVASPDRAMRRRLVREKSKLSEVLVVDLRPYKQLGEHSDDPQLVMWSHRWRVRPHKRRWIDKAGNYRETTVSGYVKGPEHLPLIEKDKVFHVRR